MSSRSMTWLIILAGLVGLYVAYRQKKRGYSISVRNADQTMASFMYIAILAIVGFVFIRSFSP